VCTPKSVFQPVLDALGWQKFDLDPCSHPETIIPARATVMLPEYRGTFEEQDHHGDVIYGDGLSVDWGGLRTWLNTPYSQLQYDKKYPWLTKAAEEAESAVAFLPSRTSTAWWHNHVRNAQMLCKLRGRVKHVGHEHGSPFHQSLVFWGFREKQLKAIHSALDADRDGRHWVMRL
jgi:hypothetical protein